MMPSSPQSVTIGTGDRNRRSQYEPDGGLEGTGPRVYLAQRSGAPVELLDELTQGTAVSENAVSGRVRGRHGTCRKRRDACIPAAFVDCMNKLIATGSNRLPSRKFQIGLPV